MSAALLRNMCNLQTPGSSPQDVEREKLYRHLPRHVQYACQYCVEHLACADPELWSHLGLRDGSIVHEFFQRYYLYWLEAMSLIGKISEAVLMVAKIGGMLRVSPPNCCFTIPCWSKLTFCIRATRILLCVL